MFEAKFKIFEQKNHLLFIPKSRSYFKKKKFKQEYQEPKGSVYEFIKYWNNFRICLNSMAALQE